MPTSLLHRKAIPCLLGLYLLSSSLSQAAEAVADVKTKESMIEMDKELRGIVGQRSATERELATAKKNQTLTLPGSWETLEAVQTSIGEIVRYGLPDDYFITYPQKVRALELSDLKRAADTVVHPDQLVWVVVGDRAKVEPAIAELGWGGITLLDADGNSVQPRMDTNKHE